MIASWDMASVYISIFLLLTGRRIANDERLSTCIIHSVQTNFVTGAIHKLRHTGYDSLK